MHHSDSTKEGKANSKAGPGPRTPKILGGTAVRPEGPPGWPPDDPAVVEVLARMGRDGSWGRYHGPHCEILTARLAELHGCEHVHLASSGTVAVELALRGVKIGPGDEVILAAYDFKGNFQDVLTVGAVPVLVDIDPMSGNLAVERLEAAITPATRAILVSHLHGGVVPMPEVMRIAAARGTAVIEDACQMPGAMIGGRIAGTWGDVGILSFGGSKLLTAGRGGALVTRSADIVQRVRLYVQRGNDAYPFSEMQAAVLVPQLDRLAADNARRAAAAARLNELLAERQIDGLRPFRSSGVGIGDTQPGFYKIGMWYEPAAFGGLSRDAFANAIRSEGVALDPGFRALHASHSARRYRAAGDLVHASRADCHLLTLHHPVLLGSEQDLVQIVEAIERVRDWGEEIARSSRAC